MDNNLFDKEEQSYNKAVDTVIEGLEVDELIQKAEERSARDMAERRRILEQKGFIGKPEREELNERYRANLEEQIRLQDERREILELLAQEVKVYQESYQAAQEELKPSVLVRENTTLLDEGVRQTLMDVSAIRKANLEDLIENNPAWKRFVAPESYVRDEIVTRGTIEKNILTFNDHDKDFTPELAKPIDGPAKGLQAALRQLDDPQTVVRVADFALDIEGTIDPTLPNKSEVDLVSDYLKAKTPAERDEIVNGELTGSALPLQWALSEVDPSKRDKVCIETLKGYGIDTSEFEKERGLLKVTEPKTPELTPREKELAHVATLLSKIEPPTLALESRPGLEQALLKEKSLTMERD